MDLNKVMIIGNLTRDPELRNIPSGEAVTSFGVATNRVWTNAQGQKQQAAEFHNVVAWRRLAEICAQYLKKGNKVYIEGRLQTREWEGQDGIKRYRTEIVARDLIMLSAPSQAPRATTGAPMMTPRPQVASSEAIPTIELEAAPETPPPPKKEKEEKAPANPSEEEGISIEDIPF